MYHDFASVYDQLQDADYEQFADYYEQIFEKFNLKPELVLDLACGTGNVTLAMAQRGYDMIGIDLSVEMLNIAREKAADAGQNILFLNQDMTEFELYGTVDTIICALDGINYLTEDGQLEQVFRLAENYLNPGGIMIFDINSEYKLKHILGEKTFVNEENGIYYVWQNFYESDTGICRFVLNFFRRQTDGSYLRFDEFQEERVYTESEIRAIAECSNLEFLGCYAPFTLLPPSEREERLFFTLRKKQLTNG